MGGSSSVAPIGEGYNTGTLQALQNSNLLTSGAIGMTPELQVADIPYLNHMAALQAEINARQSAALESKLSPTTASIRSGLGEHIDQDLNGGPSKELSNMWLKQGLQDAIATGANTNGSFARSALADSTRSDYIADRDRNEAKAASYLSANPTPQVGLDVGSLISQINQARTGNIASRDAWRSNNLGLLQNDNSNMLSALQQGAQRQAGQNAANANAANTVASNNGQLAGAGTALVGSLAMAAAVY